MSLAPAAREADCPAAVLQDVGLRAAVLPGVGLMAVAPWPGLSMGDLVLPFPVGVLLASRLHGSRDQDVAPGERTFTLTPRESTSTCRPLESTSTLTPTLTSTPTALRTMLRSASYSA